MKSKLKTLAAAALIAAAISPAAQAAVVNGSFEAEVRASGTWANYANLTGWTGGPAGIELRNNVAGAAYDGNNYVELDTYRNSLMSQAVTTANALYTLIFAYSPRQQVGAGSNGIEVWWNGTLAGFFTGTGASSGNNWSLFSLSVLGTSPTSLLEFRASGTSDSLGGSLDAVSLVRANPQNPVSEPAALALLGAGLASLGFSARRKTKKQA